MTQPRYTETPGTRYLVECLAPKPARRPTSGQPATNARSFRTYDLADQYLDRHEQNCPHAHRINRLTTLVETLPTTETVRTIQAGTDR